MLQNMKLTGFNEYLRSPLNLNLDFVGFSLVFDATLSTDPNF